MLAHRLFLITSLLIVLLVLHVIVERCDVHTRSDGSLLGHVLLVSLSVKVLLSPINTFTEQSVKISGNLRSTDQPHRGG